MSDPGHVIDPHAASVARAYDYLLGGKDNFAVDRAFAESLLERDPQLRTTAKLNKEFGRRVTRYIAGQGVRQFIDLGSGIPTSPPSVHETARQTDSTANVVYVDHDPVVVTHSRVLRAAAPGLAVLQASFTDADGILEHPDLLAHIDFNEPLAVLALSIFQNTPHDRVLEVLRRFRAQMAPGSYLAISHVSARAETVYQEQIRDSAAKYGYPPVTLRTDAEIGAMFEGFSVVPPGVVDYRDWHPEGTGRPGVNIPLVGAVGRLSDTD